MGVLAGCTSSKTIASVSNPLFPTWHLDAEPTSLLTIFSLCRQLSTRLCQKGVPEGDRWAGELPSHPCECQADPLPTSSRWIHFWFLQPVQPSCNPSETPTQEAGTLFFCNLGSILWGPSASSEPSARVTQQSPPECLSLCVQGPSSRLLSFHIPISSSYSSDLGGNHFLHLLHRYSSISSDFLAP